MMFIGIMLIIVGILALVASTIGLVTLVCLLLQSALWLSSAASAS